jgi:hypothetical protein
MNDIKLKTIPFVSSGLAYGGTPEENAANYMKIQTEKQLEMNNKYGGSGRRKIKNKLKNKSRKISKKHKKKYTRNRKYIYSKKYIKKMYNLKGGVGETVIVPQFPNNNLNNSPQNPNSASLLLNKIYIDSINNSRYDCYATNSCSKSGGRRRKTNKINRKNKYYKNISGGNGCRCSIYNNSLLIGGYKKKCNCTNISNKIKKLFRY